MVLLYGGYGNNSPIVLTSSGVNGMKTSLRCHDYNKKAASSKLCKLTLQYELDSDSLEGAKLSLI